MLRITDLRLPLNHTEEQLQAAVLQRLGLKPGQAAELLGFTVYKRAHDARKKTAMQLIYTLDCELASPDRKSVV